MKHRYVAISPKISPAPIARILALTGGTAILAAGGAFAITQAQADRLQWYAPGQSRYAMGELLGGTYDQRGDTDIWEIQGTGYIAADGTQISATQKLIVNYDRDGQSTDWRVQ